MQDTPALSEFAQTLTQAIAAPMTANLVELLREFEQTMGELSQAMQLRVAAELLSQLTELYVVRAETLLQTWEDRHNPVRSEPILTAELMQGLLRQTLALDLTALVQNFEPRSRQGTPIESVAGEVEKSAVLEFLADVEQAEAAFNIAYDEDVTAWGATIAQWMHDNQRQEVMLTELLSALDLPIVPLWLALLLGEYVLEPQGEFYSGSVRVRSPAVSQSVASVARIST